MTFTDALGRTLAPGDLVAVPAVRHSRTSIVIARIEDVGEKIKTTRLHDSRSSTPTMLTAVTYQTCSHMLKLDPSDSDIAALARRT